jgi:nitrogenase molybdenum-cofactor synthesis protein NifE
MVRKQSVLEERKNSIIDKSSLCRGDGKGISCNKSSVSGAVSQRACMFSGARVVLNPITDAYHIIHGPIGCASYTWDIRGSLTSGEEIFRTSYSTDLRETDVIFGGEKKLAAAIDELVVKESAKLIFVYGTCIVGVIGDDIDAICSSAEEKHGIRVIPVKASGFSGTKSQGYKLACDAIMQVIAPYKDIPKVKGVNILGDFNLAGEMWIIKNYMKKIGINVISTATGDASFASLIKMPSAQLNVVQCAGSSTYLANRLEEELGIPFIKVSFFGAEDTTNSLIRIAQALGDETALKKALAFTAEEGKAAEEFLDLYRPSFRDKKAAIYVGGGFKAISLIKQFNEMGIETVVVGTQTGKEEDYEIIEQLVSENTVILDDANPSELEEFMLEKGANILVGGVKERPLAYKLGIAFCDHNHERKHALAGFEGIRNFTREVNLSINSPVWAYCHLAARLEGL